jgi:clan AA aspartic protease
MTSILNLQKNMGKVYTDLTITNRGDQFLARRGLIDEIEVRSLTLKKVLVDTGATTLCLPEEVIETLGLEVLKKVDVVTALGLGKAKIYRDATISLHGREGTFECLGLPRGCDALLGVIPLEMLGLEPDLQNQTLRALPSETVDTYLTIL